MRKGQLEFIVVLGIIVVIVVVAFYALQTGIIPTASANPDVRLVQDSTNNFIRNAAYDTLRKVSDNGGYLEPQASDVSFLGLNVPYWTRNGQIMAPNVQQNIVTGITDYITQNRASFASSVSGKTVTFGQPQVTVNVLDSQLSITVYMPTTVNGVQVPQPYIVSVPTKIGEVIDFSTALTQSQLQNRYLEYFIISSMLISPYRGPAQEIPTFIYLTKCGEFVFKNWWEVKPYLEETIKSTLAHTYMPDKYPMNVEQTSGFPKYAIPEMSGKKNFDINVSFMVSDSFSLDPSNFQMNPEIVMAIAQPLGMTGICVSDPINVLYYMHFPAIVSVNDPLTGNKFRFAIDTYIKDNMPGEWSAGSYQRSVQAQICSALGCNANVKVVNMQGAPLSGASVSYMGCSIGATGSDGVLSAMAPCGYGPLQAFKNGYSTSPVGVDSENITNITVTMAGVPSLNLHFYEAMIEVMSGALLQNGSLYAIPSSGEGEYNLPGVNPINAFSQRPVMAYLRLQNMDTLEIYERFFDMRVATLSGVPSGRYAVSGALVSPTMTEIYGSIAARFDITDSMNGKDIYVYLPYNYAYSKLTDKAGRINGGVLLTSVLSNCGIGPISVTEYNLANLPCSKNFDELQV